jgi:hypothetical protein
VKTPCPVSNGFPKIHSAIITYLCHFITPMARKHNFKTRLNKLMVAGIINLMVYATA